MASPHENVYTRLQPAANGVGVFAICPISKGTRIFSPDPTDIVWLERNDVAKLPLAIQKLYHDFCVVRGTKLGCPTNFNAMTPSWYVNHSDRPNAICNDQLEFIAKHDIKPGEEILVDYRTYND